jgi:ribosomal-protein-alanine N-acetyltransferase
VDNSTGAAEPVYRSAIRRDLGDIAALEREMFPENPFHYVILRQLFDLHGAHWVVADIGAKARGYALVGIDAPQRGWVLGLAVEPAYQCHGIGTALLQRAVARCRTALVDTVCMTMRPGDQGLARLYHKAGFSLAASDPDYFGEGHARDLLIHRIQQRHQNTAIADPNDNPWLKDQTPGGRRIPLLWWK